MDFEVVQAAIARARDVVIASIEEGGVEGHLCALVLRPDAPAWASSAIKAMLRRPAPRLSRTTGAAIAGLRAALDVAPDDAAALASALERELSREAIPSATRIHDDERWLIGIAAGARHFPALASRMDELVDEVSARSPRWRVVGRFARWLCLGVRDPSADARLVSLEAENAQEFEDAVPLLWLAGDVLGTTRKADALLLGQLEVALRRLRGAVVLGLPDTLAPLDAAWLLHALCALPEHPPSSYVDGYAYVARENPLPMLVRDDTFVEYRREERPLARPKGADSFGGEDDTFRQEVAAGRPSTTLSGRLMQADVLLVVVTDVERDAVFAAAGVGRPAPVVHGRERSYHDLGSLGGARVLLAQTEMGTATPGGTIMTVSAAIREVQPSTILMVGIAFGMDPDKQPIGQILVSRQLQQYDIRRVGTDAEGKALIVPRGDKATAHATALSRLRAASAGFEEADVKFGLLLSGEKLVDNQAYREELRAGEPEAIGGEMEGGGLYVAASEAHRPWCVVKAVCDHADGNKRENKKERQEIAARNAARFVVKALEGGGFAHAQGANSGAFR